MSRWYFTYLDVGLDTTNSLDREVVPNDTDLLGLDASLFGLGFAPSQHRLQVKRACSLASGALFRIEGALVLGNGDALLANLGKLTAQSAESGFGTLHVDAIVDVDGALRLERVAVIAALFRGARGHDSGFVGCAALKGSRG